MPASNGDITESFFHLSSDHSDRLSSGDDLSVHTMDDMSTFMRLARAHDMNTRRANGARDFLGDDVFRSKDTGQNGRDHVGEFTQNRIDQYKRTLSDSILVPGSSNAIPVNRGRLASRNNMPLSHSEDVFEGSSGHNTLDGNAPNFSVEYPDLRQEPSAANGIDVESLFRAFEPLLDQYLRSKNGAITTPKNTQNGPNGPDSDADSAVDDTFDRPKRGNIKTRGEISSPVTSPPQSSGDSQFYFDKSTDVEDSDVCQQILPQISQLPQEQKGSKRAQKKRHSGAPHIHLGELTADEIELDLHPDGDADESSSKENHTNSFEVLQLKLEQYKKDNDGMSNEIAFLRSKLEELSSAKEVAQNGETRKSTSEISEKSDSDAAKVGFEENLPDQFRPYYQRLQLHKVDDLSGSEKSNLIKNLMLSLLTSDFDHLSVMTPKVGAYLRITTKFLDDLHERLYPEQEMKPSQYLRNYNITIDSGLQECLEGMGKALFESETGC